MKHPSLVNSLFCGCKALCCTFLGKTTNDDKRHALELLWGIQYTCIFTYIYKWYKVVYHYNLEISNTSFYLYVDPYIGVLHSFLASKMRPSPGARGPEDPQQPGIFQGPSHGQKCHVFFSLSLASNDHASNLHQFNQIVPCSSRNACGETIAKY